MTELASEKNLPEALSSLAGGYRVIDEYVKPIFRSHFFAWLVKLIHKAEFMYTQPSPSACSLDSQKRVRNVR
jgi:hypothetical protein